MSTGNLPDNLPDIDPEERYIYYRNYISMNLYLIDGNSYVYRAYYAIRGLTNSKGLPTNAIYGFTNTLLKIIREKRPDGLAVSFDSYAPTERHKLFEEYKAQRPETPDELIQQLPHIREVLGAFNIKIFELPGYEADDIIGTVAKEAAQRGVNVFIVTSDKDMLQLIDEHIKIYDPMKDRILDEAYVKEKFGIGPERVPEFMALTGDAVDNIPGIKGIGEKTARELLLTFKSIEELLAHPERIGKEKLRMLIAENVDLVRLSQKLSTINTSVPVDFDVEEFSLQEPEWQKLLSLFSEFEFSSLLKLIPAEAGGDRKHELIRSLDRLGEIVSAINMSTTHREFAFSIEATDRNPMTASIVGFSLSKESGTGYYIPLSHSSASGEGFPLQITKNDALSIIAPLFENAGIPKISHNIKYGIMILRQNGILTKGKLYDTMIASYLLNPNKPNHSLEDVAIEYLSYKKKDLTEVLNKRASIADIPLQEATTYSSENAVIAFELKEILFEKMLKEANLESVYFEIEMPLINVLSDIERSGVKIDINSLNDISKELERELDSIQKRIYFLSGEEFNINSPKQLSRVLFHTLGLKPGKKTKTGFSTEVGVLEELAASHELPHEILNWRSLYKLKTTYVDVLPTLINPQTGRIHTSFNQAATATGRLSSSDPNLQNIPVRGEWGKRMRGTFIAEEGNLLLSADYSQVELRILAHLSQDAGLIDAFKNNLDIHARTASELFGIPIDRIMPDMRRIAKTVNFGVIYGISPFGLSEALGISKEDAKKYIEQYFERHSGVKQYIEETLEEAKRNGYVSTLFGRKRAIPELKSQNATIRQQGERLVINSPIQGTAADVIKIAMIRIWRELRDRGLKARMILQVHDELLFELPKGDLKIVQDIVKKGMEGVISLSVPLKVDINYGKNWAEAHA
ncbi:MAG: DNA polymerase I [Nitrospira sp.]|nr:DNA polymerase I [Nitrospira sp.]